ncbi:NADH-quinone oxidoreductase subunit NuoE [Pikeienuella sp. HZG-20]|uniref:NADH-quinone oxidoreductase subunit NuoE n=1 Tax=Paludibacillus litoralis TaxID=3133267 RepID=UPI0030EF8648
MLRSLHHVQPESFAFTPENLKWAQAQIAKYPEGRQASAVIPILWRAQEQEGWVTRPMIEVVGKMLGMANIRVLEVATFYYQFHLQPVGAIAHFQICGTTSCMICGAEDLVAVCREKIAPNPNQLSPDGKFSWEEVECIGACSNAPVAQIGKDYYEDLTAARFAEIIDEFGAGKTPTPGPQNGRYASEPITGLTSLMIPEAERVAENASKELARLLDDTSKRITDGRGMDRTAARKMKQAQDASADEAKPADEPKAPQEAAAQAAAPGDGPPTLKAAREGGADDLKRIKGIGPKLEALLNEMGIFHFDQIANWTPADVAWVGERLDFHGRVEREDWIGQAKALADE